MFQAIVNSKSLSFFSGLVGGTAIANVARRDGGGDYQVLKTAAAFLFPTVMGAIIGSLSENENLSAGGWFLMLFSLGASAGQLGNVIAHRFSH